MVYPCSARQNCLRCNDAPCVSNAAPYFGGHPNQLLQQNDLGTNPWTTTTTTISSSFKWLVHRHEKIHLTFIYCTLRFNNLHNIIQHAPDYLRGSIVIVGGDTDRVCI